MSRLIKTEPAPAPRLDVPAGCMLVAPNSVRRHETQVWSLYQIGKTALKKNGFGIATPIIAADALRKAVRKVLPHADASSVSRHYRETVATILRSGIDTDKLVISGSERVGHAGLIAAAYKQLL